MELILSRYFWFIGVRCIRPSSAFCIRTTICSSPAWSPAPIGICHAGPKNLTMSGCIKAIRSRPPAMPIPNGLSGLKLSFSSLIIFNSSSSWRAIDAICPAGRPSVIAFTASSTSISSGTNKPIFDSRIPSSKAKSIGCVTSEQRRSYSGSLTLVVIVRISPPSLTIE